MTFCSKEKTGLAEFLFSLCVYSDYCCDRKGPPNPTMTQSWHHCRASSITIYNSYSLGLHVAAWWRKLSDRITRRHVVQSLVERWTGDSEDSEKTILEKGTQSHPTHTWDKRTSTQRRILQTYLRAYLASLIRCKSPLLPGLIAAHSVCWGSLKKTVTCVTFYSSCCERPPLLCAGHLWFFQDREHYELHNLHGKTKGLCKRGGRWRLELTGQLERTRLITKWD